MDASHRAHGKNLDIEVLRAVAIIGTLWAHLDILFYWGSPALKAISTVFVFWGGVDLFFAISGYVITSSLLRAMEDAASLRDLAIPFWIRRFWRIVPSAWAWLAVTLIASMLFQHTGYLGTPRGNLTDTLWSVAQLANLHFSRVYAHLTDNYGINQVYWSLSLEEQCYLVMPFILFLASRSWSVFVLFVIVAAQIFLSRPFLGTLWFFRTDALALGALIAMARGTSAYHRIEPTILRRRLISYGALAGTVLLIGAIGGNSGSFSLATSAMGVVAAAAVWIASYDRDYTMPRGPTKRLLTYLGARSYAIYLIHIPVYRGLREATASIPVDVISQGFYPIAYFVIAIVATLAISEINYRYIETPLRRFGARIADARSQGRQSSPEVSSSLTTSGRFIRNDA
ncbi:acyltransferase family protein [Luteibacter yeojuensis]|uniref:Acyltransferase n=1 Tax=Luteibacter yeojuensis TaxID=345309 RepID=A0A7X5QU00_9GAMM|nr:acyltransferase [Luteibacter yeojuensis]NID15369.1 acyltransferase [Luteibacter yeojuensis]